MSLQLDENYSIETDENNVTLYFREQKIRQEGKNKGEQYTSETPYYYPSVQTALRKYIDLRQKEAVDNKTVEQLVELTEELYKKINLWK